MVGADQQRLVFASVVLRIVREHISRSPRDLALIAQDTEIDIERQPSQRHNHLNRLQQLQFALQIRAAGTNFLQRGLVVRRRAANRRADVRVSQLQAVVSRNAVGLRGEARIEQNFIQKIA